jgi:thiol-disulfide isomerase/thioredoxin
MIELSEDNLNEQLKTNDKVVVQYGASWCGNCRIIKPKFRKLSEKYDDIEFIYVDAEKFPNSRKLANVKNLPTFASFKNNNLISEKEGNRLDIIKEIIEAL